MWWDPYNLFRGEEFDRFWEDHLKTERRLLFIVGMGFDPRMLGALRKIALLGPNAQRQCVAIDIRGNYSNDEAASKSREKNVLGLAKLFPGRTLQVRHLAPADTDGIRNVSRNAAALFADIETFRSYTDIILDISALPRLVYLTFLNVFLGWLVRPKTDAPLATDINLHVVYGESALIDAAIIKTEVDLDLAPMHNLTIRLDEEASMEWPVIWFPVLGEGVEEKLQRIWERTNPSDVYPILPIQSADPRRGDNIICDIGDLIFDRFGAGPRDLIHATEWNPFQLYRSLIDTMSRYEETLIFLGGARFVISPLSSKSLSLGCLLACFEKRVCADRSTVRVGMAHVETRRYEAHRIADGADAVPISLWLTGDCYAVND